jgi:Ca-activated chloride channel family protein
MTRLLVAALFVLLLLQPAAAGPLAPPRDRTLSPYFFVKGGDPAVDRLPLKSTGANVDITGVIARVKVSQVYRNEGKRPIEAIYVFPGSTRAAVHGMRMTIGTRVITAQIEERQEARRQYEQARQAGQTASLLEQQRPNVFQMNVANIMPGDEIKVELVYTELLVPEKGVYEFVYPTVVGPRYTTDTAGAPKSSGWTRNPYLRQGEAAPYAFGFRARIAAGMPLKEVTSPSHEMKTVFSNEQTATLSLPEADASGGNRDVVVRYRLADDRIATGLLLYEGADEKFFLCLVEPPKRFGAAAIPPREYIFIMDVSGSMNGFPIETSKEVLRNVLGKLHAGDTFNVLFFSGGSWALSPTSLAATPANKAFALQEIERQQGGGGTELLPALQRAFGLPRAREGVSRVIVIATDGYVSVEREAFTLIRDHLNDANVFTFGIGSSVNRHLIEGMARVGEGAPFVVLTPEEARDAAGRFLEYIESPLLTHVEVRAEGFQVYDLEPARIPDLFAERPLVLVGKYRGEPTGTITITGFTGQGRFERRLQVSRDPDGARNDPVKYLWARERVALLSDFATLGGVTDNRQEIVTLGLKYNLLTEFTSFVAIDQQVRNTDGRPVTVKQPLPLPQSVSDLAVGGNGRMVGGVARMAAAESVMVAPSAPVTADARAAKGAVNQATLAPPPPPLRARIEVVENRLQSAAPIPADRLREVVVKALATTVPSCFASSGVTGTRLARITFDGNGRVARVDILEQERWKDTPQFVASLQSTIRKALALPWAAGGYVVVRVG